jgi:uncharacterized protein DUF4157
MSAARDHQRERDRASPPAPQGRTVAGDALRRLASGIGNAAMARFAASGSGLLSGGAVHPDVEAAISAARGGGATLDSGVRDRVAPSIGDSLSDVRVHDDAGADALARSVAARAFTVGADVFFAKGEYQPGTPGGDRLLAHELTHVAQQRGGSQTGPLRVTDPGGALESEAEAIADGLDGA